MAANRTQLAAALLFATVGAAEAQTFPAAGIDEFNVTVITELFDDTACTVASGGPRFPQGVMLAKHGTPSDPGDGQDEVALEILSLSIADGSLSMVEAPGGSDPNDAGDPPCVGGAASADGGSGCSPGLLKASQASPDFPATFDLDLYFEMSEGGATLFNKTGARIADANPIVQMPFPHGAAFFGDPACVPLYDVADPLGPAVRSFRSVGFIAGPATAEPATALKLVLIDKPGAPPDKMVFKSLDPNVFAPCDPDSLTVDVSVSYDAATGSFSVPAGAFDGTVGWKERAAPPPSTGFTCRYKNGAAPGGAGNVKSVRFAPLKIVARGLGDVPIDLLGAGAPSGSVNVVTHITSGESRITLCTEFTDCIYALIGGGTGAKLKCNNGTPSPTCLPIE